MRNIQNCKKYQMNQMIYSIHPSVDYYQAPQTNYEPAPFQYNLQDLPQELFFSSPHMNIVCSQIWVEDGNIIVKSSVTHYNGLLMEIKPSLVSAFLKAIGPQNESIRISLAKPIMNIVIQYELLGSLREDLPQIKDRYFSLVRNSYGILSVALSTIGKMRKIGSFQKKISSEQLAMRKNIFEIINSTPKIQFHFKDSSSVSKQSEKALVQVKKIIEVENMKDSLKVKHGGYCYVEPMKCLVTKRNDDESQQILAVKRLKNIGNQSLKEKMNREMELVSRIKNGDYTCKYYKVEETPHIYMSYAPRSLRDLLSKKVLNDNLEVETILSLAQKIVSGVKTLHESGIIHRDLKPQNILISEDLSKINIIDFGESTTSESSPSNISLGSTFPYSPMECILGEGEGFNKFEIDYWSVNMILYEMVFKCLPFSFSRSISVEIVEDWKKSPLFTTYQFYRRKRGLAGMSQIMSLISIFGLQVEQSKRLSLDQLQGILERVQVYYQNCLYY